MAVSANLDKILMKANEGDDLKTLVDAPVTVIAGVSDDDAAALQQAFGIKTVRDLGTNKYFKAAAAMVALHDAAS